MLFKAIARKAVHVVGLQEKLALGRPLRVKYGIDPTSPHVHLGHTVPLRMLADFQAHGHKPVIIVGDFTAGLGDPSGRDEVRAAATDIQGNADKYLKQIGRFINLDKAEVYRNGAWFDNMRLAYVIRLCQQITLQRLTERDDFTKRIKASSPVYLHELLYPLLQAYDSVHINADVELGGTEQLFTLKLGRMLMDGAGAIDRPAVTEPQAYVTLPILRGTDGERRMGKSLGNFVGVGEDHFEMFSKVMSVPDQVLPEWFMLLFGMDGPGIVAKQGPFEAKKYLAYLVVNECHTMIEAVDADHRWTQQFSKREEPAVMPEAAVVGPHTVVELLLKVQLAPSKNQARRLVEGGSVKYNKAKISDPLEVISPATGDVLKVGRKYVKLRVGCETSSALTGGG